MKWLSVFLILLFFYQINHSLSYYQTYSLDKIFEIFKNLKADENDLKTIIDCFIRLFNQVYSYTEVAKNPPQPSFNNSYHEKVDIEKGLRNIKTKDTNMYEFYRELRLLFDRLGDGHLNIQINRFLLKNVKFTDPIKLNIKIYNGKPRMFATIKISESNYKYFRNNDTMFKMIKDNYEVPITKINGKDPFDFVTEFGGVFCKLKSIQGTFRYKFAHLSKELTFNSYPLTKEDLSNFSVEYENGNKFTTDYVVYSDTNINKNISSFKNEFKSFVAKIKKNKDEEAKNVLKDILTFNSNNIFDNLFINEINEKINLGASSINWKYYEQNQIGCKVDEIHKVNIYGILSFMSNGDNYINVIEKCTELFDENNYPIIAINILNGGGIIHNSHFLVEALSPKTAVNMYVAFRNKGLYKDVPEIKLIIGSLYDVDNCESLSYRSLTKNHHTVDYGDSVSDSLLGPLFLSGMPLKKRLIPLKKKLKNPRNPTDIIVYTDGFSFSATSLLFKFLQYYGGCISVGYFPNPNLPKEYYDSSLSPSSILAQDALKFFQPDGFKTLSEKYNYEFVITGSQIFYSPDDFRRPLEYEVTPVDEIVNIYLNDLDTLNPSSIFNNKENYEVFINESLRIFDKYKKNCNPKNKKLLLITDECKGKFGNEHMHGGYACSDDGVWDKTTCVPSYCDIGYIYDHKNKKCIADTCKIGDPSLIIIVVVISSIVLIFVISILICYCIHKKNKERKLREYNISKISAAESINRDEITETLQ